MAERTAGDPRIGVTGSEGAAMKHAVQPSSDTPVANDQSEGTCAFCGNAAFRRSRVRFTDLMRLLMLRYPVRCVRCGQRQHVAFGVASAAQPAKTQSIGASPDKSGSWQRFTADRPGSLPHGRPATTAAEPVAERLADAFEPGPPVNLRGSVSAPPSAQPYAAQAIPSQAAAPQTSAPPARTPSRRSDSSGIW